MKTINYLLIAFVASAFVNCSAAPKNAPENANIARRNSSEMPATNANAPAANAAIQTQTAAPDALVRDLYKTHEKNAGAIVQGKNRQPLDKYFDKNLAGLIWKDMTTNRNEVGVIDFDIFYNTQDPNIKNLSVGAAQIAGEKATVPVTFENYETVNDLTYALVKEGGSWKISDISYGADENLLKYFKESAPNENQNSNAPGDFEGKYQVGDTTCTVTPAKMSFNVKWAKGAGAETFFYKESDNGKQVFESDAEDGKTNAFEFDDENYNGGTFYRTDGKTLPVKRIK